MSLRKGDSLCHERIQVRRGEAGPIGIQSAHIAVAHVVHQKNQDVGWAVRSDQWQGVCNENQGGKKAMGFHDGDAFTCSKR